MTRNKILFAMTALLVVASVAFADVVETHNRRLRGTTPAAVAAQTSLTVTQSVAWTSAPIDPKATNGNQKVVVDMNFGTASATCVVSCGRYFYDGTTYTLLGIKQVTLTGSADQTNGLLGNALRYLATGPAEFDTLGATHYDVRLGTPSAGAVTALHYAGFSAARDGE